MNKDKIHIQLLDGTTAWVPVNSKRLENKRYEILNDSEFELADDRTTVFEFYPGDIVELKNHKFESGEQAKVAGRIVEHGNWKNRKLNELIFNGTLGQLDLDEQTARNFQHEIELIEHQKTNGEFHYPELLNTIDQLKSFL